MTTEEALSVSRGLQRPRASMVMLSVALAAAGCTTLAPEARNIRVTENDADVAGCRVLGAVESHPPYGTPSDGMNQLKNEAAGLGADTIYLTAHGLMRGKSAMAYRCEPVPKDGSTR